MLMPQRIQRCTLAEKAMRYSQVAAVSPEALADTRVTSIRTDISLRRLRSTTTISQ